MLPYRIVFLGTPAVAAQVLKRLTVGKQESFFEVVGVVSQPPAGRQRQPSAVHQFALDHLPHIPLFLPASAKDPDFLQSLQELKPDLCLTAAYGQYLPKGFLQIPRYGTANIHPSLLPKYRGAAPVQRALEAGDSHTGVSVLLSVAAMDAGPLIAQETYQIIAEDDAPLLLEKMFKRGTELFVQNLQGYCAGQLIPTEQDHTQATKAPKITVEEGLLDPFSQTAEECLAKLKAFTPWPGCRLKVAGEPSWELKIHRAAVLPQISLPPGEGRAQEGRLMVGCAGDATLELLQVQAPGKRVLLAEDFLRGQHKPLVFLM